MATHYYQPLHGSFGDMYQFDRRYSEADLGVAPTPTATSAAIMDLAIDSTQFFVAMKAIGMNETAGLNNQMNLSPAEITILERFHQTLSDDH
ncbi:hypothetical protein FRB94_013830 [Tulasnella sp. JGI-2019a]|nr:hypothetical protein FRB94_013830 [Tulasnella sp. JGI-2019a]KAG9008545.1 hypothetical protein FRB93_006464 [Tulasnella sp. JGI-2019a]KAG9038410.1 hypothetical protein FRB95_001267 [Tulasnella sp. JGI-2019a]